MFADKYLYFIRVFINISQQANQLKKARRELALCFTDLQINKAQKIVFQKCFTDTWYHSEFTGMSVANQSASAHF